MSSLAPVIIFAVGWFLGTIITAILVSRTVVLVTRFREMGTIERPKDNADPEFEMLENRGQIGDSADADEILD